MIGLGMAFGSSGQSYRSLAMWIILWQRHADGHPPELVRVAGSMSRRRKMRRQGP
jgi:hypothetical protein